MSYLNQDFGYKPMQKPDTSASDKATNSNYDPVASAASFYDRFKRDDSEKTESNQAPSNNSPQDNTSSIQPAPASYSAPAPSPDSGGSQPSYVNPAVANNPAPGQGLHNKNPNANRGRPGARPNRGPAVRPDNAALRDKKAKARANIEMINGRAYHKETGVMAPNQGPNAAPGMRGMKNYAARIMAEREKIKNGERPAGVRAENGGFYAYKDGKHLYGGPGKGGGKPDVSIPTPVPSDGDHKFYAGGPGGYFKHENGQMLRVGGDPGFNAPSPNGQSPSEQSQLLKKKYVNSILN